MRRRELLRSALVLPGASALVALEHRWAVAHELRLPGPVQALNFALTLEYLEAEYYRQAVAAGLVAGVEAEVLSGIAADEQAHVALLTRTIRELQGTPAPPPAVRFTDALRDRESMLETALRFENAGLQGYLGGLVTLQQCLLAGPRREGPRTMGRLDAVMGPLYPDRARSRRAGRAGAPQAGSSDDGHGLAGRRSHGAGCHDGRRRRGPSAVGRCDPGAPGRNRRAARAHPVRAGP